MESMTFDKWKDIKKEPFPQHGSVVVSVQSGHANGAISAFSQVVRIDEGVPIGNDGDTYVYVREITHWQPLVLPNPVLPVAYN